MWYKRQELLDRASSVVMLFLAWLAVSFVVVAAVNLYLRYFGLPARRQPQQLTSPVDGRAYYDRSATGYMTSPAAAGAPGASAGGGWTAALFGAGHGSSTGETVCIVRVHGRT